MKVRAWAGASSFRTRQRLEKLEKIAREQVETLSKEIESDPGAGSKRQEAARKRAAEDRAKRLARALEQMAEVEQRKRSSKGKKKKKAEARSSTTDPEARVMKMADGGFRPAYNVHFVTETEQKVVLAVDVDNAGTDKHAMLPLAEQIEERYQVRPQEWLADGGCNSLDNVEKMTRRNCTVFAPPQQRHSAERKPSEAVRGDSASVQQWRARMATEEAKTIYKQRGATAELVNAHCRGQGLLQFLVRGTRKVLAVALLHALTINIRRSWAVA
jgi:DDE family transposase